MAIYTYTKNTDSRDGTGAISLRQGTLIIPIGTYADITALEVAAIQLTGRYVIVAGIVGPASPALITVPFVSQLIAGAGITLVPSSGYGTVTVTSSGGGTGAGSTGATGPTGATGATGGGTGAGS